MHASAAVIIVDRAEMCECELLLLVVLPVSASGRNVTPQDVVLVTVADHDGSDLQRPTDRPETVKAEEVCERVVLTASGNNLNLSWPRNLTGLSQPNGRYFPGRRWRDTLGQVPCRKKLFPYLNRFRRAWDVTQDEAACQVSCLESSDPKLVPARIRVLHLEVTVIKRLHG